MLPASPQIFHGRENELHLISVTLLQQRPAWIAILGPGGIGKSSLVLAALHQLEISSFFGITNLHFISCETSHSASDLTSVLAVHFGLEQTGNRAKNIIRHIRELSVLMILVLDNLDTPWEPLITRAAAEDFLCLLADIPHLSVIVCFGLCDFVQLSVLIWIRRSQCGEQKGRAKLSGQDHSYLHFARSMQRRRAQHSSIYPTRIPMILTCGKYSD